MLELYVAGKIFFFAAVLFLTKPTKKISATSHCNCSDAILQRLQRFLRVVWYLNGSSTPEVFKQESEK